MTPAMPTERDFRPDINGLRAWAVAAVVLYHFGVPGFQGGFAGVDVFFVLSGFLMTRLVVGGLQAQGDAFSISAFYLARARRIVPALAVLCAVLLVLGAVFLAPLDFRRLGQHALAALTFVSNIKFWSEAGYFDAASHEKWLLHTWSLSVEWQFYLLYPVLVKLLWRRLPDVRTVTWWIGGALVVSLLASVLLTPRMPTASFFLLQQRAWELLAGGLVYLLAERPRIRPALARALEFAGLALIVGTVVLVPATAAWPGWLATLPVLGTVLVLLAARPASLWTGSRLPQWAGNASYSLYLWHWPAVVALVYLGRQRDPMALAAGVGVALVLGHLSWQWVERPTRRALSGLSRQRAVRWLAGSAGVVLVAGVVVNAGKGLPGRLPAQAERVYAAEHDQNPRRNECHATPPAPVPGCTYGGPTLGAIVVGDSHAASFVRSVEQALGDPARHVLDWTYASCPTLAGVRRTHPVYAEPCARFVRHVMAQSATLPAAPILVINRWSYYLHGPMERGVDGEPGEAQIAFGPEDNGAGPEQAFRRRLVETACSLAKQRPTWLLRPIPELGADVPRTMARAVLLGQQRRVSISLAEYHARHRAVWEAQDAARDQCGVQILDPLPYLCSEGRCWGDRDGMPVYYDDDHLNERGAALLRPLFARMFNRAP
ncbi:acyltransferase family protein [Ramlibacter sp. PS3R-8]|uniref:acyltransferase family protein n=1 Tax=Ramlibacter sp. PS3R-8 TaxID=3133437 RepID=UPI0030A09CDA